MRRFTALILAAAILLTACREERVQTTIEDAGGLPTGIRVVATEETTAPGAGAERVSSLYGVRGPTSATESIDQITQRLTDHSFRSIETVRPYVWSGLKPDGALISIGLVSEVREDDSVDVSEEFLAKLRPTDVLIRIDP